MGTGKFTLCWLLFLASGVDADRVSPAAKAIIELQNHQSLAHCDLGLHYSRDDQAKALADEILATVHHDRPVLVVDDRVNASKYIGVYKNNVKRLSKLGIKSKVDEWCFLWIILVVEASQAEAAMLQTQSRLRSMWTDGSTNKNIVFLLNPNSSKDLLTGRFFNSFYSAESLYLVPTPRGESYDEFILHQVDPKRLRNAGDNGTILGSRLATLRTVQLQQKIRQQLFPPFGRDLQGMTLTVSLLNWTRTLVILPDGDGYVMGEGSFYNNTLGTLATKMNFQLKATIPTDGRWGELMPDGSWSGIIRDLETRVADFGPGASSSERNTVTDSLYPLGLDSLTFTMTRPKLASKWQNVFRPFDGWLLWLAVIYFVPCFGAVLLLIQLAVHDGRQTGLLSFLGNTTFIAFEMFITGSSGPMSKYKSINCVLFLFSFYAMQMVIFYKSNLVSHLTTPTYTKRIESLEELEASDLTWGTIDDGSLEVALFSNSSEGIYKRMSRDMVFCTTTEQCFDLAVEGNFAFITFTDFLVNQIKENYMDTDGEPVLVTAKEVFYTPILLPVVMPSASPLFPTANRYMLLFLAHGLVSKWEKVMSEDVKRIGRRNAQLIKKAEDQSKASPEDNNKVLAIDHLQTAFYILVGGYCIALAGFFMELVMAKKIKLSND